MSDIQINDHRPSRVRAESVRKPRAYGEDSLEDIVADLLKRVERLESQAGTS